MNRYGAGFGIMIIIMLQTLCENCEEFQCINNLCSNDSLCDDGCAQWYTASNTNTQSGFNCSLYIAELISTSEFYIEDYDKESIKFYIEMDSQVTEALAEFYSYTVEHSIGQIGNSYSTVLSGIRHSRHEHSTREKVELKLKQNTNHWFRLCLKRKQNGFSSSGDPSKPVGIYIANKDTSKNVDDKIIPLVVLLTIFVTTTIVLGVLANYLARKRYEAKENYVDNMSLDDAASRGSVISETSMEKAKANRKPATPTSLRYRETERKDSDGIVNNALVRESNSVPDFLNRGEFDPQSIRAIKQGITETCLPQVEDSPYVTRTTLDESYTSQHSDVSGRHVQIALHTNTSGDNKINKKNKHRKRDKTQDSSFASKTQDCSLIDDEGQRSTQKKERKYPECENIVTSSQVSQKLMTSKTHDEELNISEPSNLEEYFP